MTFERTPDGGVIVPRELLNVVALILRWALDRWRNVNGGPIHSRAADVRRLIEDLEAAARVPAGDLVAASGKKLDKPAGIDAHALVSASSVSSLPDRTVRQRCASGQVRGAIKIAGRWLVPAGTTIEEKP